MYRISIEIEKQDYNILRTLLIVDDDRTLISSHLFYGVVLMYVEEKSKYNLSVAVDSDDN